ncbi:MAG: tRNA (N6-threonylcarbamoyladenosine(37)-N6)-methyltransferase TrmO [Verrucomicrobia bacterium]|nr:tRNA (N6-threonylcarbamoyladenosine(37)-N6)-methyltransferase TrmO [Verrucomicrobiota bacterium]
MLRPLTQGGKEENQGADFQASPLVLRPARPPYFVLSSLNLSDELTIKPIGFIRTEKALKFNARHQPDEKKPETNILEMLPGDKYQKALQDLVGFERIWLIWWFHRNKDWRPQVLPPRGPAQRRGVFATRSPHRPNPLGITPVQLLAVQKGQLLLGPCDLVDGTPIFDIKPYIPAYDAFPEAKAGWIDEVDAALVAPPSFKVEFSTQAEEHLTWLRKKWSIDFRARLLEILTRDPTPHRTRRIRSRNGGLFDIGCGAWYAVFKIDADAITILHVKPSFPLKFLLDPERPNLPDREAQLAFRSLWPDFVD